MTILKKQTGQITDTGGRRSDVPLASSTQRKNVYVDWGIDG